ncbi:WD40/YVTN/BNR-like repeat-containing protein [Haladaptatus pallidirubidus]
MSWDTVGGEIDSNRITALATDPNGRIWAGTEPSNIYRSDDGGETWTKKSGISELASESDWSYPPRPETHNIRWIEPDPTDSDRVSVCIEQGALCIPLMVVRRGLIEWQRHREISINFECIQRYLGGSMRQLEMGLNGTEEDMLKAMITVKRGTIRTTGWKSSI